jgi:hypothetical protein
MVLLFGGRANLVWTVVGGGAVDLISPFLTGQKGLSKSVSPSSRRLVDYLALGTGGIDHHLGDLAKRVLLIWVPTFLGRVSGSSSS